MNTGSDPRRNQAVGVLFGRKHLHGCRATTTVFGSVRYEYESVEIAGSDLSDAVDQLLTRLDVQEEPTPIAAAIPTSECYFATRPINSGGGNASPRTLLRESLRSTTAKLDQLAIDVLNWQADRRPLAGIAAARLDRIEEIRLVIGKTKHHLQRIEPAANALISAAVENERQDRRDRLITRVFLGESSLLAVMTKGSRAIHWQSFPLPQGDEATGIVSIVRAVEAACFACGLDNPPEFVYIHGRAELESLIDRQWLAENLPNPYRWTENPSMRPELIAKACADGLLANVVDEFDFVREHRKPLSLSRVVPYKEIALYAAAAGLLAFVLYGRVKRNEAERVALASEAPAILTDGADPRPERDRLNARAASISQFLEDRVRWSPILGHVAAALPDGTRLTGIRGSAVMPQRRKNARNSSPTTLVLRAECVLDEKGQLPESVSKLADRVAKLECVSLHFERVEISDLRRTSSPRTGIGGAEFSIILTNSTRGKG